MNEPPPYDAPPPPAVRNGAPRRGSTPMMETVRVTAPDLQRRAVLEKTRSRLLLATGGFCLLFGAVMAKLTAPTVLFPMLPRPAVETPHVPDPDAPDPDADTARVANTTHGPRAMITDRNGEILAISLPVAGLYANPREMIDPADVAHKLKSRAAAPGRGRGARPSDVGQAVRLPGTPDHPQRADGDQHARHPRGVFPGRRAAPLPAGPCGRAGAGRGGRGQPRHRRGGAVLRPAPT